jgi:hypothetical protein
MCCRIPVIALASLEVNFEVERIMAKIHILKSSPARKRLGCICWTRIRRLARQSVTYPPGGCLSSRRVKKQFWRRQTLFSFPIAYSERCRADIAYPAGRPFESQKDLRLPILWLLKLKYPSPVQQSRLPRNPTRSTTSHFACRCAPSLSRNATQTFSRFIHAFQTKLAPLHQLRCPANLGSLVQSPTLN